MYQNWNFLVFVWNNCNFVLHHRIQLFRIVWFLMNNGLRSFLWFIFFPNKKRLTKIIFFLFVKLSLNCLDIISELRRWFFIFQILPFYFFGRTGPRLLFWDFRNDAPSGRIRLWLENVWIILFTRWFQSCFWGNSWSVNY